VQTDKSMTLCVKVLLIQDKSKQMLIVHKAGTH
jgi:hypothetical protein